MAFIQERDYKTYIKDINLDIITDSSPKDRITAENAAIEEMYGYLSAKYDAVTLFNQTGAERNPLVLMYAVDIAIYHLFTSNESAGGVPETRKERYKSAILWCIDVAKGLTSPRLPVYEAEDDTDLKFQSNAKLNHSW